MTLLEAGNDAEIERLRRELAEMTAERDRLLVHASRMANADSAQGWGAITAEQAAQWFNDARTYVAELKERAALGGE
jgi:hypothetical protein